MPQQLNSRLLLKTAAVLVLAAGAAVLVGRFLHRAAATRVLPKARSLAEEEKYDEALKLFDVHFESHTATEAELMEYAQLVLKSGRREALYRLPDVYRKVMEANPNNREALQKLTELILVAATMRIRFSPDAPNEWAEAAKLAQRMIDVAPNEPAGHLYLGRALMGMGRFPEAAKRARRLIEVAPNEPGGLLCLGRALMGMEQFAEAQAAFGKLVTAFPDNEDAYFHLAKATEEATKRAGGTGEEARKCVEEARKCVDRALASSPQSWSVHLKAHKYFAARGEEDRARKLLARALELGPEKPDVLATAAVAEERAGRPDAATPHWQKLRSASPTDPTAYVALARIARAKGDWKGALAALDEGLKQCEKNKAELHFQAASVLLDLGRRKEADPHLDQLRAIATRAPQLGLLEGQCSMAEGRLDDARRHLERAGRGLEVVARALPPLSQAHLVVGRPYLMLMDCYSLLARCYSLLGTCYLRLGELGAGTKTLTEVARLWPSSIEAHVALARALLLAQDLEAAEEHAKLATRLAQDQKRTSPEAWLTLAEACRVLSARPLAPKSLLDDAVSAAQKAVDARADARGLILLAQLLAEAGKLAQAEAALKRDPADPKDAATLQIARVTFYARVAKPPDLAKAEQEHKKAVEKQGETLELKLARVQLLSPNLTFEDKEKALQQVVATAGPGELSQARAALADFYAEHGKMDKMAEQLTAIAAAEPKDPTIRRLLLRLAFDRGDTEHAKTLVDQLAKIEGPGSSQIVCDRAEIALASADPADARRVAKEVAETLEPLRKETASWRASVLSGDAFRIQGKLPEAIDCYQAAFQANPASIRTGIPLVRALNEAERYQEASVILDRLTARAPESPVLLGLQLARFGREDNLDGALKTLKQRVEAQPNAVPILLTLGDLLLAKREFAQAEAEFRKAHAQAPKDPAILDRLTFVLRQTGRKDEGLRLCNELVAGRPDDPLAYLSRANHFRACGEHEKAVADLAQALKRADKQDGLHRDILLSLGDLAAERGETEPALAWYRKAAAIEPPGTVARKYLAERLLASGRERDTAEARALLDALLKEAPEDPHMHLLAARIAALDPGTLALAKQHCRRAIDLAPRFALPHTLLSLIHQSEGDLRLAAEEASRAVSCDARSVDALLRYAQLLRRQKRDGQAREVLQRARAVTPDSPRVILALAEMARQEAGPIAAADFLKVTIAAQRPDAEAESRLRLSMGWYLEKAGKAEEAEAQLRVACKLSHNAFDTVSTLAFFLERRKRPDETDALLKEAAAGGSKARQVSIALLRAAVLQARHRGPGDLDEAERLARSALATNPESSRGHLVLGDIAQARKDLEGAIPLYRKALDLDQRNAHAANNLAWALFKTGQPTQALPFARKAVAADDATPGFHDTLGDICFDLGLAAEAERSFARCSELLPNSPAVLLKRCRCLARLGRREEARTVLSSALRLADPNPALTPDQRTELDRLLAELKHQRTQPGM